MITKIFTCVIIGESFLEFSAAIPFVLDSELNLRNDGGVDATEEFKETVK